jgi:hypothetical protein
MIRRYLRALARVLTIPTLLKIAAALTLLGLALMVWSMLEPTPMPVILAMSAGQVVGILAFAMFGYCVIADQFRKHHEKGLKAARVAASDSSSGESYPFAGAQASVHEAPLHAGETRASREGPP